MNSFLGFPLNHSDALHNIEIMLDAGLLLISSTNEDLSEIGFSLIELTKKYSSEASLTLDKKISGSEYTEPQVTSKSTEENKVASSRFPHPYLLPDTLDERLSIAMSLRDISQGELARKVGMSQPAIFKLVNGETKTSRKIVEIALALEVNPTWLQCGKGEMTDFCISKTEEL